MNNFKHKEFISRLFKTKPTIKCLADRLNNYPEQLTNHDLRYDAQNPEALSIFYTEDDKEIKIFAPNVDELMNSIYKVINLTVFDEYMSCEAPYADNTEPYELTITNDSIMDAGININELVQDSINFLSIDMYKHMDTVLLKKLESKVNDKHHRIKKDTLSPAQIDEILTSYETKIIIASVQYSDYFDYSKYNVVLIEHDLIGNKIFTIPSNIAKQFLLSLCLQPFEVYVKEVNENVVIYSKEIRAFEFNSKLEYNMLLIG